MKTTIKAVLFEDFAGEFLTLCGVESFMDEMGHLDRVTRGDAEYTIVTGEDMAVWVEAAADDLTEEGDEASAVEALVEALKALPLVALNG